MDNTSTRFESTRYSVWDILQELICEGRREPFANLSDLLNVNKRQINGMSLTIRQSEKLYCSGKGSAVAKQNGGPIQHII